MATAKQTETYSFGEIAAHAERHARAEQRNGNRPMTELAERCRAYERGEIVARPVSIAEQLAEHAPHLLEREQDAA